MCSTTTTKAGARNLDEVARRFYLQLAAEPEIHGTDAAERAVLELGQALVSRVATAH